jgi:hypothetical protein
MSKNILIESDLKIKLKKLSQEFDTLKAEYQSKTQEYFKYKQNTEIKLIQLQAAYKQLEELIKE